MNIEPNRWFFRAGSLASDGWQAVVEPNGSDWQHTGIRIADLSVSSPELPAGEMERIVVPLAGSATIRFVLTGDNEEYEVVLTGRESVFHGPTDVVYLPRGSRVKLAGSGMIAVAEAPTTLDFPMRHVAAADVPIELRGAGRSSRQVHNFGVPEALDAGRLIVCEVVTPAENWSSYPPHKHDEEVAGEESCLEEIYYFESAVTRGVTAPSDAAPFGYFRNYSSNTGPIETLEEVRSGDIALVPRGWHGPCVAAPGYDLYYLNVMAGPGAERSWRITDDPAHSWIRDIWSGQQSDPRLPYLA